MALPQDFQEPRHPPRIAGRGRPVARRKIVQVGGGALAGMLPALAAWLVLGIGWFWCSLFALFGATCGAIAVAIGRPGWRLIHSVWRLLFGGKAKAALPPRPLEPPTIAGPEVAPRLADARHDRRSGTKDSAQ